MAKVKKSGVSGAKPMSVKGSMKAPIMPGRVYSAPSSSKSKGGKKGGKC
jgi:hypothetical protein